MSINKTVRRARVVTRRVTTGLNQHAISAAETIDAQLSAEGQEPLQHTPVLKRQAALLQTRFDAYQRAQEMLDADMGQTTTARTERDKATAELLDLVSQLSAILRTTYGPEVAAQAKLTGSIPRVPETLLSYAREVLSATDDGLVLPEPTNRFTTPLDMASARAELLVRLQTLEQALDQVTAELRDDQQARAVRNDALEAWNTEVRFARDLAQAVLVRAGRKELADRLLPTDRQILGTDDMDEDDPLNDDGP